MSKLKNSTITPRIMKGPYGKMKVYAIFTRGDWTWWILSKIPKTTQIINMSLVTSPHVPEGEMGSVYKADVINNNYIDPWSDAAPTPPDYRWVEPVKVMGNPSGSGIKSVDKLIGEYKKQAVKYQITAVDFNKMLDAIFKVVEQVLYM